ncbi:MAG: hypothetical protein KDA24_14160 [Deltaproteobacteria bacterium]|nr:hypothetical protein [Deltaproteobacteria bacterium]
MTRLAILFALTLPLAGCPTANDDDSADDGPVGEAPVLQNVTACELANSRQQCADAGNNGGISLAWDVSVTDVDGDLLNPQYFLEIDGPPWSDGFFEGDLGDGGLLRITIQCGNYALGYELPWQFAIRDAEGNESEAFAGTYTIQVDPPGFGQPGACPAL